MIGKRLSGKTLDYPTGDTQGGVITDEEAPRTDTPASVKVSVPVWSTRPAPPATSNASGLPTPRDPGAGGNYSGDSSAAATSTSTTSNSPVANSSSLAQVDYKIRRDAVIDQFKSGYPTDFASESFAIAFAILLRQWKRDNRDTDITAVPRAMKRLYQQVTREIGDGGAPERHDSPVKSSTDMLQASSSHGASVLTATASSTPRASTPAPPLSQTRITLHHKRLDRLGRFARKAERQPDFERYPALMTRLKQEAHVWESKNTGGSFDLALKTIFENALLECFHDTCRLMGDAPSLELNDMQEKVKQWKAQNKGVDLTLEALWRIMPKLMPSLTANAVKQTAATRNAEAVTEAFMQRTGVVRELQENRLLKKCFLRDIKAWIALGQFNQHLEVAVRQIYHKALILQYQRSLAATGLDPAQTEQVRLAAVQWCKDHDADVLTTGVLAALSDSVTGKHNG